MRRMIGMVTVVERDEEEMQIWKLIKNEEERRIEDAEKRG